MRHVVRVVGHWALLLHIYTSMAGFTLVLLFAITGLTLNHDDFGLSQPKISKSMIVVPASCTTNGRRGNRDPRTSGKAR
jgi:hypothetical protein